MVSVIHLVGVDLSVFSKQDLLLILKLMITQLQIPSTQYCTLPEFQDLYNLFFLVLFFLYFKLFLILTPLEETEGLVFIT